MIALPRRRAALLGVLALVLQRSAIAAPTLGSTKPPAHAEAPSEALTWGELDERASLGLSPRQKRLAERPSLPEGSIRACSDRRPVCVHAPAAVDQRAVELALRDADSAFLALDALKLPHPQSDGTRGGDDRFDIYLDPSIDGVDVSLDVGMTNALRDSAPAFARVAPSSSGTCEMSSRIGTAIAQGALLGLDGSTDPGVLDMASRYIGTLIAPCSATEMAEVDAFQRAPDRCLTGEHHGGQQGSFLFPQFLDERFGASAPGAMITSLIAISDQPAPADKPTWPDKPGVFDALRSTFKANNTSLGEVMLDFDVSRAFIGSKSDDAHMFDVDRFGDLGRVRVEWSATYGSLPRRLAPTRPLDALGASYVYLDLKDAPAGADVTFALDWEKPFLFRWSLVKIGKDGAEMSRTDVAPIFGEYHAEKWIRDLDGVAGILVVVENDGEWSKSQPFDPGEPRLMPKSYTVTLYKAQAP